MAGNQTHIEELQLLLATGPSLQPCFVLKIVQNPNRARSLLDSFLKIPVPELDRHLAQIFFFNATFHLEGGKPIIILVLVLMPLAPVQYRV